MKPYRGILSQWCIIPVDAQLFRIRGMAKDATGRIVLRTTSLVMSCDFEKGYVETLNSRYDLTPLATTLPAPKK